MSITFEPVDGHDRDLALAAGGDDFDTKPIRFQPLIDKITSLLARPVVQ